VLEIITPPITKGLLNSTAEHRGMVSLADSWDSYEGILHLKPSSPRGVGHHTLQWAGERLPGFALAALLAIVADSLADWIGTHLLRYARSPLSGGPFAIGFGILI